MTIDKVDIHIEDQDVQDDVGAEWIVLSESEQDVILVEQEPGSRRSPPVTFPKAATTR